jgi:hypothetical protein
MMARTSNVDDALSPHDAAFFTGRVEVIANVRLDGDSLVQ